MMLSFGLKLCSNKDCSTGTPISNSDTFVYLSPISGDDQQCAPDIDDNGTPDDDAGNPQQSAPNIFRKAYHNTQCLTPTGGQGKCDYVSKIRIYYSTDSYHPDKPAKDKPDLKNKLSQWCTVGIGQ